MKILLATGGSAGHIFPALAVAEELQRQGHEIVLAGVFADFLDHVRSKGWPVHEIPARGLNLHTPGSVFISLLYMLKSLKESDILLKKLRPDFVVGFGGYGAFPVVCAALYRRFPAMIHEQNVRPGRANRILARLGAKVAVSFVTSRKFFSPDKTVYTGYPAYRVRGREYGISELKKGFGLDENLFTFFVLGGSQGSRRINSVFSKTVPLLKEQMAFQVIHTTGRQDHTAVVEEYRRQGIRHHTVPFLEAVDKAYQCADLMVARAGAGTVMEIAAYGLPAVLVPYPYAQGHQRDNARELARSQTVRVLDDKGLSPEILSRTILDLVQNQNGARGTAHPIFVPDAARRMAAEIVRLKQ